ncbi:carbohydrate ABC transporter substrate-binding protein [Clostridium isatidis]|uniref:Carbohydrate ABC transporter substrate-binding protein n=1 Tax=Clostridium isatidis TaxID=182773 RepID=A0A343JFK9_9CLOT|nr:carbohydrate ABC transporter substrate-binding protein [Clostridium isatidis]ASW44317.1 carbohydrate ABC transporter substrate-binding protein [Clostridium isatidis]
MKKLLCMSLMALMVTTSFTGCGSKSTDETSGETSGKRILKVAAFEDGNGGDIWRNLETAFETANPDVDIELQLSSKLDEELRPQMLDGEYPDVVYYNIGQKSGFTETMIKEEALLDISDVFTGELKDKLADGFAENAITQPYGDGKTYLAPIFYSPTGLWYDASQFENEKLPATWDEMWTYGDKLKAEGKALFTYPTSGYFDGTLFALLYQAGGSDYYKKALEYDENTWNSKEGQLVIDTVDKLSKYTWDATVANANSDGGFKKNQQAVIDGQVAFMPNGNWVVGEMAESTPEGFKWGFMPLPAYEEGGKRYAYTFFEQVWVPKEGKNHDDAKEFIKFLYSDEAIDIMLDNKVQNKDGQMVATPVVQPVKGIVDKLDGDMKLFYSIYEQEGVLPALGNWAATDTIEGLDFNKAVYGAIDSLVDGSMTADQWKTQLNETFEKCRAALK